VPNVTSRKRVPFDVLRRSQRSPRVLSPRVAVWHTYWRARIAALLGERERSLALIRDAIQQGRDYLEVHGEADFAALRDMPSFRNLMQPQG